LLADDNSMLVPNPNSTNFQNDNNVVFAHIHEWFKVNLLSINFNKTNCIQFAAKGKSISDINITYHNIQIVLITNRKFLEIFMNDTLTSEKT